MIVTSNIRKIVQQNDERNVNYETRVPPMETREVLLKADKVSVVFERLADGKIR